MPLAGLVERPLVRAGQTVGQDNMISEGNAEGRSHVGIKRKLAYEHRFKPFRSIKCGGSCFLGAKYQVYDGCLAWQLLIRRHAMLRSRFPGEPAPAHLAAAVTKRQRL
jgi:hypothetical protein